MKSRDLVVPALVLIGGAVIGRVIGVKPLLKGALTAANFAGYGPRDLATKAAQNTVRKTRRAARKVASKVNGRTTGKASSSRKTSARQAASAKRPIQKKSSAV
jgi:hypothetical protein